MMEREKLACKIEELMNTLDKRSELGKVWHSLSEGERRRIAEKIAERALEEFSNRPRLRNVLIVPWLPPRGHLGQGCKCLRISRDGELYFYKAQGDWGCVLGLESF